MTYKLDFMNGNIEPDYDELLELCGLESKSDLFPKTLSDDGKDIDPVLHEQLLQAQKLLVQFFGEVKDDQHRKTYADETNKLAEHLLGTYYLYCSDPSQSDGELTRYFSWLKKRILKASEIINRIVLLLPGTENLEMLKEVAKIYSDAAERIDENKANHTMSAK